MVNHPSPLAEALGTDDYAEFVALCEGIRKAYEPIQQFCTQNKRSFDYLMQEETPLSSEVLILAEPFTVAVQKITEFASTQVSGGVPLQSFQVEVQRLSFGVLPFVRWVASNTSWLDDAMKESQKALLMESLFSEKPASKK